MEIRNLQTFVHICDNGSFSKTAENLGYTQSTVSSHIQQLENELGVPLFNRNGKRFSLSIKGKELLYYARNILAQVNEATSVVTDASTPCGELRIGVIETISTYLLPPILEKYIIANQNVKVYIKTATTLEIMKMLNKGEIDIMITLDDPLYTPNWVCAFRKTTPIRYLCSATHPFAKRYDISLQEFAKENILMTEKLCNYRNSFEKLCNLHHVIPNSNLEIGCTQTIIDYTKKGLGVTILPEFTVTPFIENKTLSVINVRDSEIEMEIQLIYRNDIWLSPAAKEFISEFQI